MTIRALHISHTDVRSDSRILKEIAAVAEIPGLNVVGIGVEDTNSAPISSTRSDIVLETIRPVTRRLKRLPRPAYLLLAFIELTVRQVLAGWVVRPKIIHCHDTLVLPAGVILKWLTRVPLVYDAHELESQKNGQTPLLSKATLLIERACWPWVDCLVSVSDSITDWYQRNLPARPSAVVLNSPVFKSKHSRCIGERSTHLRDAFGIHPSDRVFLYVGILAKGRGIEMMLEVFSSLPRHAHLVLMGYGELDTQIRVASAEYPNIHLHPPVEHSRVVEYASGADVGMCFVENVSLSDYLCLPNKLFEYSFAGVPVLASDFPEMKRVVQQYSLGTVCLPTPEAIRVAVTTMLESPARSSVAEDLTPLSWQAQASKLVRLYHQLIPGIGP